MWPAYGIVKSPGECGLAMVALLVTVVIVMLVSLALIGLMYTDVTHASIQHAVARSFYIAQAGLEEAKIHVGQAADPGAYTTPSDGVTAAFGGGQFTYWVDTGLATECGGGLKTLEAKGQVMYLRWRFSTRVRACGVPGTPFLAALFGVSSVEFQGIRSRTYLAPALIGTPGGGGSIGSFTEINFADNEVRVNALSENFSDTVTLRDGATFDYALFGFPERPTYTSNPTTDPTPWILSAFGDLVKAKPTTGLVGTPCGRPYGCVTVGNRVADVAGVADLRRANYLPHLYMRGMREATWPPLALYSESFRRAAARNIANAAINSRAGLRKKIDALYNEAQFQQIIFYLSNHPSEVLHGTAYVDGTLHVLMNVSLGGTAGDVTLAVGGDLIIHRKRTLTNRHEHSTVVGRRNPGIVVFGSAGLPMSATPCGPEVVNGSGRLIVCAGGTLVVDGLVYTQDGMGDG